MENKQTENIDLFTQYFEKKIAPLIFDANRIKERYRSRFWGCFWTVIFLLCINALFILFRTLIYNRPFNIEQFILVFACAPFVIAWPLWQYKQQKQPDILDVFLKFYGNWQHTKTAENSDTDHETPTIPQHQTAQISHKIIGTYAGTNIELRDTQYFAKQKKKNEGVVIELNMPYDIKHEILLFEKSTLRRRFKPKDMSEIGDQIYIPAAGYFSIFSPEKVAPKQLLCSAFFETLLDFKDIFGARYMSAWLKNRQIKIYLESSRIYFDHSNIWSKKIDKARYQKLHEQFEHLFRFIETMQELLTQKEY